MELAFIGAGVKSVFPKSSKDFPYVTLMVFRVVRVDEDIVEVDNNTLIEYVPEHIVYKSLKSNRSISKTFKDNQPLKRAVAHAESSFPLVALRDAEIYSDRQK